MGSPYRDFLRPPGRVRNEHEVAQYSRLLADRVAVAIAGDRFAIVVGGDCSVVLGALLGVKQILRAGTSSRPSKTRRRH